MPKRQAPSGTLSRTCGAPSVRGQCKDALPVSPAMVVLMDSVARD